MRAPALISRFAAAAAAAGKAWSAGRSPPVTPARANLRESASNYCICVGPQRLETGLVSIGVIRLSRGRKLGTLVLDDLASLPAFYASPLLRKEPPMNLTI